METNTIDNKCQNADNTQGILFWDVHDLGLVRFWLKPPKDGNIYAKQPICGFYFNPDEDVLGYIEEAKKKYKEQYGETFNKL